MQIPLIFRFVSWGRGNRQGCAWSRVLCVPRVYILILDFVLSQLKRAETGDLYEPSAGRVAPEILGYDFLFCFGVFECQARCSVYVQMFVLMDKTLLETMRLKQLFPGNHVARVTFGVRLGIPYYEKVISHPKFVTLCRMRFPLSFQNYSGPARERMVRSV